MRWNQTFRHRTAVWRRGAVVLALALAAGCASKSPPAPSIVGLWQAQEIAGRLAVRTGSALLNDVVAVAAADGVTATHSIFGGSWTTEARANTAHE